MVRVRLIGLAVALVFLAVRPAMADEAATKRCSALIGGRFVDLPSAPTWVINAIHHEATPTTRAYCEIEGYVNPTVNFGLALPSEGWNGKYMVRGCGGSCGHVVLEGACGKHLRDGYACLHTDMGHHSDQIDNNWVANNLQGLVDFGYRATHVTTVAGKAIVAAYYQSAAKKSYFYACSTGGRQAMIEAQRFPLDFDGIVGVAPVNISGFGYALDYAAPTAMNTGADGQAILPDIKVPVVYKAVIAQCDANDGVRDGLVDPRDCKFDPASVQCKTGDAADCLTAAQVDMVRKFYARGAAVGSELNWINNWTRKPGPAVEFAQSRGDPAVIETLNNAGNPDLRAFHAHGGKLILAHGMTDLIVPPARTFDYYELATHTMGGLTETQKFFRYFVIPGMDHCSGGDGAWGVNYVGAIERWVEKGEAPDKLVGVHPKLGVALDYFGVDADLLKPDEIAFSRPYFPYPLRAYYSGRGDPNSAASFSAGLKPLGRMAANPEKMAAVDADHLAAELSVLIAATEQAYLASGLPPKNVTDRIGKAVRRKIYTTTASTAVIAAAIKKVGASKLSDIARDAIDLVKPEFPG